MPIRVFIDGAVHPPEEAKVSVLDRGFLYGDSVYETIGTIHGRLFAARDHLDRLERSARRIGMRVPPRAEIEQAIARTVEAAGNPETRVRVILTRGVGKLDLDPASSDDPRLVVIASPLGAARRASGAYEAILCADDGGVAEGASSNVFAVVGGEVWTPGSDVGILD